MRSAKVLGLMLLLLALATTGWAQSTTGDIAGTITDASGAVVPNATVTLTNTDRNAVVRTVTTNNSGAYSAPLLPIGHYSVAVEAQGFQKFTQSNIVLNVGDKLTVSPQLKVGSTGQEVTVEATTAEVQTQSPQAAALISGTQVRELALNGRNWEQLVLLSPGVSDAGNSDQLYVGAFAPQGTNLVTFSMNGGRREHNNFMVDGADNIDRGSNLTLLSFPSVDSIAEFRVIRGQYDPEYGRADSGQVNVVTRGGTSKLHGNVYEFFRNDALNARPFSSKYPVLTPHIPYLRYHDFGGTIGGPLYIPKLYEQTNKTFFFFSEEVRRNLTYTNGSAVVPTTAMLNGQFAHPVCVAFSATNTCTATGTSIPVTDPIAKAYITDVFSKYPTPNSGAFGFTSTLRNVFNFREEIGRIDHIFSQKFTIYGKILRDTIPTEESGGLFSSGPPIQGVGTTSTNSPGYQYNVRATISLTPTLLIEPGYNYSYGAIISNPIGLAAAANSPNVISATKSILPYAPTLDRIPTLSLTGGNGPGSFGPYRDYNRNHTAFGNVTKIKGTHTLKFGGSYYHYNKSENAGGNNTGTFAYNNNGLPSTGGAISFEQAWANFLLGRIGTFSQSSLDLVADINDNQFEYYGQDTWRIRPNLTFTYGARHSLFRQPTDGKGLLGQFDPATYDLSKAPCILSSGALDISRNASGQIVSACNPNYDPLNGYIYPTPPPGVSGHKSPYGSKIGKEYNWGIAPRIGLAWDPWGDGKTSIRAGWGMFYDNGIIFGNAENDIFLGSGYLTNLSVTNSTTASPTGGTVGFSAAAPAVQERIPIDYKYPYTSQWSLDVQHEVAAGWVMDIGYYGNIGIHQPGFYDFNAPAINAYAACTPTTKCFSPGSQNPKTAAYGVDFSTTFNSVPYNALVTSANSTKLQALRPYIGFTGGSGVFNIYNSNYHGLQTQLQKQFKGNSLINIAYTWSHGLTNYQADRSTGSIMPLQGNFAGNWGPSIGDRRHVLTANFVWDLPWFKTQQGFSGHVLGGWEVSGIQTFQTGLPATIASNQLVDPTGADCITTSPCSLRANQVGDPNSNQPLSYENWFNATAFTDPQPGQTVQGTSKPGALRLPGFWRTDLSLFKNMKFTERFGGQFRFETFNTFNHTNPICCGSFTTSSSLYNKIRSARDPRIVQVALKLQF